MAEYWTELPPKAELEQQLHAAIIEARERLARRGVLLGDLTTRDDMGVSKGLEFPVVALVGVGYTPAKGEDEQEVVRGCLCGGDAGYAEAGDGRGGELWGRI